MDLISFRTCVTVALFSLLSTRTCSNHDTLTTWMHLGLLSSNVRHDPNMITLPRGSFHPELVTLPVAQSDWCQSIEGLVDHQIALCRKNPQIFAKVEDAAQMALKECQHQFRSERWNCTNIKDRRNAHKETKESAFITAIMSAAVVHTVVRACSAGNVSECGCDTRKTSQKGADGWTWSGCSDNVDFGLWFSRQFNDAPEEVKRKDARSLRDAIHLHNKATGRAVIHGQVQKYCRCHGVSGSCELRTCWRRLIPFTNTSSVLKQKYHRAVRVAKKYATKLRRRGNNTKRAPVSNQDLVYLDKSPDYCRQDIRKGIWGTTGRVCNATSTESDSCGILCCGRGFNTQITWERKKCECKFVWCCEVVCKTCSTSKEVHTCK
ncbi:hypothetical protein RvY_15760 [Ramazzottius varieornatus]|uniref:Protein Wnt n=1 Tax=Ramazzottius varieornatus TaxID=947166 RepID=A0A1D1VW26_RAMVA|nr:hypothetical protein RvY_15760 [Ramazzottius varieornatus]